MLTLQLIDEVLNNKLIEIHGSPIQLAETCLTDSDLYIQNYIKSTLSYHLDPKRFEMGMPTFDSFFTAIATGEYYFIDSETGEKVYQGVSVEDALSKYDPVTESQDILSLIKRRKELEAQLVIVNKQILLNLSEAETSLTDLATGITNYQKALSQTLADIIDGEGAITAETVEEFTTVITLAKQLSSHLAKICSF